LGLLSQYGNSLTGRVVKVHQYYYKVHQANLNGRIYYAYRIRFDKRYARLVEIREGCPFDWEGEAVRPTMGEYLELFVL